LGRRRRLSHPSAHALGLTIYDDAANDLTSAHLQQRTVTDIIMLYGNLNEGKASMTKTTASADEATFEELQAEAEAVRGRINRL
jgi:hypothetical protein